MPTISRSFFIYFFSTIINLLVSYGLLVLLLKTLPKAQYGQYGLYISVFLIVLIFYNFGHKEAVFKFSSKNNSLHKLNALFSSFFIWNFILFAAIQILLWLNFTIYLVAMVFLLNNWLLTGVAYFRGQKRYKIDAFALPTQRFFWLLFCLGFFLIHDELTLNEVFIAALAASAITVVIFIIPSKAQFKTALTSAFLQQSQFRLLIKFLIIEASSVFYLKSDVLLLHFYHIKLSIIADYFFAIQLFEIIVLIIMPIGYFYFNGLSNQGNGKSDKPIKKYTIKSYLLPMLLIVFSIQLGVFFLAPIVFPWVIPKYVSSINSVLLMIFALYPVVVNILLSSKLIFENREFVYAKICFIALIFNVIINLLLIPYWHVEGVLVTKFLTELLISVFLFRVVKKNNS